VITSANIFILSFSLFLLLTGIDCDHQSTSDFTIARQNNADSLSRVSGTELKLGIPPGHTQFANFSPFSLDDLLIVTDPDDNTGSIITLISLLKADELVHRVGVNGVKNELQKLITEILERVLEVIE